MVICALKHISWLALPLVLYNCSYTCNVNCTSVHILYLVQSRNHCEIIYLFLIFFEGQFSWIDSYLSFKSYGFTLEYEPGSKIQIGYLVEDQNSWAMGSSRYLQKRVTVTMIDSKVITTDFHSCAMQMLNISCAIDNILHMQIPTDIPQICYAMVVISE